MSESPFFSILLPTKNRSHLVGFAIRSVVQQDFADFELIICDNDDDPQATKAVVEPFVRDARVKYIRTGGLDMIANWNTALDASTGQHVTVLEDKMIFYPGALNGIYQDIMASSSGVVVWKCDVIEDEGYAPVLIQQPVVANQPVSSDSVLEKVVANVMAHWTILPRGLCCSVPKSLIDSIIEQTGRPFYEPVSPDFISAIKLLAFVGEYLLAGGVYTMITSNKVSNGKRISRRKFKDHSYFMGHNKISLNLDGVYVKSDWIVVNSVIADYMKSRKELGGRLEKFPVSNRRYFEMLLREFLVNSMAERRMIWERHELRQLFFGGDGPTKNLVYAARHLSGLIFHKISKRLLRREMAGGSTKCVLLSDSTMYINQYLNDELTIANRGGYG